ncbi:SubName: Full=Related to G-patch-domain Zn-finger DNA-binding protein-Laccaria bicolor {ECO:0000313/EMBL:CCA71816.1} [Serendipita indica DSM 11827]|nr:SubName: Full=Related to G-patch-domain Zn-finger DNA-binding protein-Laccaria bicolor {ECO:0000313/EMBL:CCA71816.1} [Serendipita indica DSM 11827]
MSAASIARWKAIPMERDKPSAGTKRARDDSSDDGGNDDDDNISLVSRSPSPKPMSAQEMLRKGIDDYTHGNLEEEIATLETRIKATNIGYSMLARMGWNPGDGLGLNGTGRPDPIPFSLKNDTSGLGKTRMDFEMIDATVGQRRDLESERQTRETDEEKRTREESVARQAAIQTEITGVLKPFYCQLCDKQFLNVGQYDEHTNSYAHHHKARMKDLNASAKVGKESQSVRAEKERKREEPTLLPSFGTPSTPGEGSQKTGWASVTSASTSSKSGGWATVGAAKPPGASPIILDPAQSPAPPAEAPPPLPPTEAPPPLPPSDSPPPVPPLDDHPTKPVTKRAPRFKSSGWTNLTHQLEEKAILDSTTIGSKDDSGMMDSSSDIQKTPSSSPKHMVIDVDALYPPTPGPALPMHTKTPGWRIHEAPSPSPHVGSGPGGAMANYFSPIGDRGSNAATRGRVPIRGKLVGKGYQPAFRASSPMQDLESAPPGYKR